MVLHKCTLLEMSLIAHKSPAAMSLNSLQSIALLRVSEALNVLQPKAPRPKDRTQNTPPTYGQRVLT